MFINTHMYNHPRSERWYRSTLLCLLMGKCKPKQNKNNKTLQGHFLPEYGSVISLSFL